MTGDRSDEDFEDAYSSTEKKSSGPHERAPAHHTRVPGNGFRRGARCVNALVGAAIIDAQGH